VTVGRNIMAVRNSWKRNAPKAAVAFPILVAAWPRNEREVLRIILSKYKGRVSIDVRIWFLVRGGEPRPGRRGISLRLGEILDVRDGLRIAAELGLAGPPVSKQKK
jgi:hypothetical protein